MKTTTPCRIYVHPTAATSPKAVSAITRSTGLAVIIGGRSSAAELVPQPTDRQADLGPAGGDAA